MDNAQLAVRLRFNVIANRIYSILLFSRNIIYESTTQDKHEFSILKFYFNTIFYQCVSYTSIFVICIGIYFLKSSLELCIKFKVICTLYHF